LSAPAVRVNCAGSRRDAYEHACRRAAAGTPLAYRYSRRHANDPRFTFGTGKLGDLAGFTSAIILAMIALLIGYESINRLFASVPIHFSEAIPIACLGLAVNIASAWLLSGGDHHHHRHSHGHGHDDGVPDHDEAHRIATRSGGLVLDVFEDGVPPRFRLHAGKGLALSANTASVETVRADGARRRFTFVNRGDYLESIDEIPEPHDVTPIDNFRKILFSTVLKAVAGVEA
jgi:Cation efflux family